MKSIESRSENIYSMYGIECYKKLSCIEDFGDDLQIIQGSPGSDLCVQIIDEPVLADGISGFIKGGGSYHLLPLFQVPKEANFDLEQLFFRSISGSEYCCAGLRDGNAFIGFDVFHHIGRLLSGHLDHVFRNFSQRDRPYVDLPVVDFYVKLLDDLVLAVAREHSVSIFLRDRWPEDKPFVLCLTHDVDRVKKTYQYLSYSFKALLKADLSYVLRNLFSFFESQDSFWNFDHIMGVEDNHGVKSTFFPLNESGEKSLKPSSWILYTGRPDLGDKRLQETIRGLDKSGWEIGVHGSFNSYNDPDLIFKEKKFIEDLLSHSVSGIRQHHLNLDVPQTWVIHEKTGFKYDCSLGFSSNTGFRWGTCHPFRPFYPQQNRVLDLFEIPTTIMDTALFRKEDPLTDALSLIDRVQEYGGVLNIIWHQSSFNPKMNPEYIDVYERIIEECQNRNAWITTCDELLTWVSQRV